MVMCSLSQASHGCVVFWDRARVHCYGHGCGEIISIHGQCVCLLMQILNVLWALSVSIIYSWIMRYLDAILRNPREDIEEGNTLESRFLREKSKAVAYDKESEQAFSLPCRKAILISDTHFSRLHRRHLSSWSFFSFAATFHDRFCSRS